MPPNGVSFSSGDLFRTNNYYRETSCKMKHGKETWWWYEDVHESIQTKKLAKRTLDKDNNEENKAAYKTPKKKAKNNVAITKART